MNISGVHPAVTLALEIGGLLLAIAFVLQCIVKLDKKLRAANETIETAKDLPGGLYGPNKEDANEHELEKAWWQAHA